MKWCPIRGGKEILRFQDKKRAKKPYRSVLLWISRVGSVPWSALICCYVKSFSWVPQEWGKPHFIEVYVPWWEGICPCLWPPCAKYKQAAVAPRNLCLLKAAVEQRLWSFPFLGTLLYPNSSCIWPRNKSTNNSKLYCPDVRNFPCLLCVAIAMLSALSLTSVGACGVYKGKRVLWAMLESKRRPGGWKKKD